MQRALHEHSDQGGLLSKAQGSMFSSVGVNPHGGKIYFEVKNRLLKLSGEHFISEY